MISTKRDSRLSAGRIGIRKGLLICFTVLVPFTDSPLQSSTLGVLAATPAVFPLMAYALLAVHGLTTVRFKRLALLMAALFVLYAVAVSAFGLTMAESELRGESAIVKGFKLLVIYGGFAYVAHVFSSTRVEWSLGVALRLAYLVALAGLVIDPWGATEFFHYSDNLNGRPRGLSMESSHLAASLVPLALLAVTAERKPTIKFLYVATLVLALFVVDSKGGYLASILALGFVLSTGLGGFLARRRSGWMASQSAVVLIALAGAMMVAWLISGADQRPTLLQRAEAEITEHTSIATRAGMMQVVWTGIVDYPLGVGPFGWTTLIDQKLNDVAYRPTVWCLNDANMAELRALAEAQDAKNLSTKTFAGDMALMFGWPFLILFHLGSLILVLALTRRGCWVLAFGVAYSWLALSSFVTGGPLYALAMVYGLALARVRVCGRMRRVPCECS